MTSSFADKGRSSVWIHWTIGKLCKFVIYNCYRLVFCCVGCSELVKCSIFFRVKDLSDLVQLQLASVVGLL